MSEWLLDDQLPGPRRPVSAPPQLRGPGVCESFASHTRPEPVHTLPGRTPKGVAVEGAGSSQPPLPRGVHLRQPPPASGLPWETGDTCLAGPHPEGSVRTSVTDPRRTEPRWVPRARLGCSRWMTPTINAGRSEPPLSSQPRAEPLWAPEEWRPLPPPALLRLHGAGCAEGWDTGPQAAAYTAAVSSHVPGGRTAHVGSCSVCLSGALGLACGPLSPRPP